MNFILSSPLDPQNSALWGWTKGLIWSLAGKQKNPQSQTKNLPTVTAGNLLRNCWYGNYCSAGKLSPPGGHPQSLPFLLSIAFVFLTHPLFSSLSHGFKFQRLARLLKSSYVLCLKAPPEFVLRVQPGWPHFSVLCDRPGTSLWVPSCHQWQYQWQKLLKSL